MWKIPLVGRHGLHDAEICPVVNANEDVGDQVAELHAPEQVVVLGEAVVDHSEGLEENRDRHADGPVSVFRCPCLHLWADLDVFRQETIVVVPVSVFSLVKVLDAPVPGEIGARAHGSCLDGKPNPLLDGFNLEGLREVV